MNKLEKKLQKEASIFKLTSDEKRSMRMALDEHIRLNPLGSVRSPWSIWMLSPRVAVPVLAVLLLCASAAGTAYAAQGALPGDLLYSVKVSITEPIEVALATTPMAKAQVEAHLSQNRVEEARALADRGDLNATTAQELQVSFTAHATQAVVFAELADSAQPHLEQHATSTASVTATTTSAKNSIAASKKQATSTQIEVEGAITTQIKAHLKIQADILDSIQLHLESEQKDNTNNQPKLNTQTSRYKDSRNRSAVKNGSSEPAHTDQEFSSTTTSATTILKTPAPAATTTATSSTAVVASTTVPISTQSSTQSPSNSDDHSGGSSNTGTGSSSGENNGGIIPPLLQSLPHL